MGERLRPLADWLRGRTPSQSRPEATRGAAFSRIWGRSTVTASAGGSLAGIVLAPYAVALTAPFGFLFGLLLGSLGGLAIAAVGARSIERGDDPARLTVLARRAAMLVVGVWWLLVVCLVGTVTTRLLVLVVLTSVAAWTASPWLVSWHTGPTTSDAPDEGRHD